MMDSSTTILHGGRALQDTRLSAKWIISEWGVGREQLEEKGRGKHSRGKFP